jgi:hypothetical protein
MSDLIERLRHEYCDEACEKNRFEAADELEAQRMYEGVRRSAEYMRRTQDEPNFDGPGDDDEL